MKIDHESLYQQLGLLVATMPNLYGVTWRTPETQRWLVGHAAALVEASGAASYDIAGFNVASDGLGNSLHQQNVQAITAIPHRALARAELAATLSSQGAFITG